MTSGPDDPEVTTGDESDNDDDDEHGPIEGVLEELREMPVGTRDPNIIGDAGPYDVPPGTDPPEGLLLESEPDEGSEP